MTDKDAKTCLNLGNLEKAARSTAANVNIRGNVSGRVLADEGFRTLRRLKAKLAEIPSDAAGLSQAAEWFSDNWYIAEREGKDGIESIKRAGKFPMMDDGRRRPAASEAAQVLILAGKGEVTPEYIQVFLTEYQKTAELSQKELSLFTAFLKLELVSFLCNVLPERWDGLGLDNEEETVLLKNVFTSLRLLSQIDVSDIIEKTNRVENALLEDPAGIYPLMDEETRYNYRRTLANIARQAGIGEYEAARTVVGLCTSGKEKHVGYYIFVKPLGKNRKERTGAGYISSIVLISLFITVLTGFLLKTPVIPALLLIPVSEAVKNMTDYICLRIVKPKRIPRIDLEKGIPKSGRTICVISALLTDEKSGEKYTRLLEEYSLLNRDTEKNLLFGILADFGEAATEHEKSDGIIVEQAANAVKQVNEKYGGGFFLLLRNRELCEADGRYMAKERKRGAISELVKMLSGEKSTLRVVAGNKKELEGVNFILTLDADTRLTAGSAKEMIGAALHPLNVPEIDEKRGRVVSGYGIFQPRVSTELKAAGRSDFTRIFAGQGGIDPYNAAVSDVYQDLFGEGTFMGKGLINVPVYARLLENAFPDNTVLSHDILEGAYLRCAYISDTELTDGYPYKVTSYFSRQERWTRGDWQNIRWMLHRVKVRSGALIENQLGDINRWKIFDNLRRSLVPVMIFAALVAGMVFSGRGFAWAAVIAIAAHASGLLLTSAEMIIRHDGRTKARYQSAIISGVAGGMMQTAIRLMLIPAEAWNQLKAICCAVYRMTVSHRNMLNWVTSSEAERKYGNTVAVNYLKLASCPISGLLVAMLSPYAAAAAMGIIWIFAPAYAWALSRETRRTKEVAQADKGFLISCARDIWRYFEDNLTKANNYLPPDNVQEEPATGAAHRTSPTNIGLAMLSLLSAADLGIIEWPKAEKLLIMMLDTVEKLDKWRGHLYNWYDTRTCEPLEPKYVSTVDSGNLAGCLTVLKQAFLETGREMEAKRCGILVNSMDFGTLFDKKRKLFYIGYDINKGEATQGWYDLLASEARATSYIAIASGQVPRKHWRRLSRALVSQDNFSGMVSWTGTMFEYLMPNLIMPCYNDSLLFESSKFCIYAQKKAHQGIPWGISESAYYAFDPGLSYKYKAHGVQRLALKRKMGTEVVISPYSSFLALNLDTKGAVKNLRKLADIGAAGKYGFYEAVDYTPSRQSGKKCEIVRSYMAHHLGMSLTAIANLLCGDIMPRRFMSDICMAAYSELLEERVPCGEIVLRQPPRDVPEKPSRHEDSEYLERGREVDAIAPRCLPLSNGKYHVLFTESGKSWSRWGQIEMARFQEEPDGAGGLEFYLKTSDGIVPLQPAPYFSRDTEYSWEFGDGSGMISASWRGINTSVRTIVPPASEGELRKIEITAAGKANGECELICVFEPVLQKRGDYESHPSFSKLSLEAEMIGGTLLIRRRLSGNKGQAFMAIASSRSMRCITERERGNPLDVGEFKKTSPDMRISCIIPIEFSGGRCSVMLSLAAGYARDECAAAAKRMLEYNENQTISRISASALMLDLRVSDMRRALSLARDLMFVKSGSQRRQSILETGRWSRENLWKFGISGDIPILAVKINEGEQIDKALDAVRDYGFLLENGVSFDLAVITTDGGDYRSPQRTAVQELLRQIGKDGMIGAPGGVHIIDTGDRDWEAVEALADVFMDVGGSDHEAARCSAFPLPRPEYARGNEQAAYKFGENGEFIMAINDMLPPVAWSHVMANRDFGFLATEAGTGYMWYKNSREMKINRWLCDPMTIYGTERLELVRNGERVSLFASGDGRRTLVKYGFGWASWEREIGNLRTKVTAFVPDGMPARVLMVELRGAIDNWLLEYYTDVSMGGNNSLANTAAVWREEGALCARNLCGEYSDTVFRTVPSSEPYDTCFSRNSVITGEFNNDIAGPRCIAMRLVPGEQTVIVSGCAGTAQLRGLCSWEEAVRSLQETKNFWRTQVKPLEITTGHSILDEYVNGWALYQTIACRILARTSLYQNGGAVGFRDQLQDVCAIMASDPSTAAEQIRRACGHQYTDGDVQHWWHPGPSGDKGVRTRCSDDLLWLPYSLCRYVELTDDHGICRMTAPYLISRPLDSDEHDRYECPEISSDKDTLLNHAVRAADMFIRRGTGPHGLALMGGGDWNDGMDRVGSGGRGESVWLTQFGSLVLSRLAGLCRRQGEQNTAVRFQRTADTLLDAAQRAWSGNWYLRGYYDSGETLGGPDDAECQIDSISQSFALFAGADSEKCRKALDVAYTRLYDTENRVLKLFEPPFDNGKSEPGYIKGYAPGFRENGGQYTHGAIWLAMAVIRSGEALRGAEMLEFLAPGGREQAKYKVEPYVIAADVYSAKGHEGRGGWTWYTGSSGWYYRAVTEELLGLRVRGGKLYIEPSLPQKWGECRVKYYGTLEPLDVAIKPTTGGYDISVNGKKYDPDGYHMKIYNKFVSTSGNV